MSLEDPLPFYLRHLSDKELAEFIREHAPNVGRNYRTAGDVVNAPDAHIVIGLLHLILDELQQKGKGKRCPLQLHREWLLNGRPIFDRLTKQHLAAARRAAKRIGVKPEMLGEDAKPVSWQRAEWIWKHPRRLSKRMTFDDVCDRIRNKIARLDSVQTIKDVRKLTGIGPARERALREQSTANPITETSR